MIGSFTDTWALLHELPTPSIAAVQGWCIAGGTNIVFNADLIVAAEDARFGYPPSRVWGVPEAPWTWVARMGLERAKRYLFTGDENFDRLDAVIAHLGDDFFFQHVAGFTEDFAGFHVDLRHAVEAVRPRRMYMPEE